MRSGPTHSPGCLVGVLLVLLVLAGARTQERRVITVTEGFDAYARGEYGQVTDAIARVDDRVAFAREMERPRR